MCVKCQNRAQNIHLQIATIKKKKTFKQHYKLHSTQIIKVLCVRSFVRKQEIEQYESYLPFL